jgi:hypothetical protein
LRSLSLKDKRHNLQSRKKEALRRLGDLDDDAGRPGDNLCRFTGPKSAEEQTGKRPWFYDKRRVGQAANALCGPVVEEAFSSEKFRKEQEIACGDKEYVYGYKRGDKRVKAHCRELAGPTKEKRKRKQMQQDWYSSTNQKGAKWNAIAKNEMESWAKQQAAKSKGPKTKIAKGTKLSDADKAKIKAYGDSLKRGDKARLVGRVRIYMLQGLSFEAAKARAEGRDVVTGPMKTTSKKSKQSKKPASSSFIDAEASASDEDESDEDDFDDDDREFLDDDEQGASFGPMTAMQ